ncbi:hypothetical protein [Desertivirga arenae]|uniref:hypothetical protein n=1 Tax=Desertivirga arenae TaxID=2810309 RepID=UPI001A96FCF6|nr:hypothetical protein [Pedobacter sp. SYSU D00823]
MTISFDLDDLLIPGVKTFVTERRTWLQRLLGIEQIRYGAIDLFRELQRQGHSIFIYTTSFRSTSKIRLMLFSYRISAKKIINQSLHERVLRGDRKRTSKFPPAFGIDIHVDDSAGLKIEGERYNFATIIIAEDDDKWKETVLAGLKSYSGQHHV